MVNGVFDFPRDVAGWSRCRPGGVVEHDAASVVLVGAVAAAGPLDVLHGDVGGFGLGVGGSGPDERGNRWPPGVDGLLQPARLGHRGEGDVAVEGGSFTLGVSDGGTGQDAAELFLDAPCGADLTGRVVLGENGFELGAAAGG